ncbi:MAG: universal stress protein [Deltaproteobacteria bacterium]|nr:universal stress protein [Deltaproteobacteria bacterium]
MSQGVAWAGKDVAEFLREVYQGLENEALEQVKAIESELKKTGFKVKVKVERGVPQTKILGAEQEEDVSVIVLGSHGKSNLTEMLLGSVSEHVIRYCKNPVLVIKRD